MKIKIMTVTLITSLLILTSCSKPLKVTRVDVKEQIDLSGRWNDTDSRDTAETMIRDLLNRNWIYEFKEENGKKPTVIVGRVRNLSSEHIDVGTFIKDIERELINSGNIKFVASATQREEIRTERKEQQTYASEETAKSLGQETGADFILQGSIRSIIDAANGHKLKFYQIDLELINIENNEKVWIGDHQCKKFISRSKAKW